MLEIDTEDTQHAHMCARTTRTHIHKNINAHTHTHKMHTSTCAHAHKHAHAHTTTHAHTHTNTHRIYMRIHKTYIIKPPRPLSLLAGSKPIVSEQRSDLNKRAI